jgi:hypothetical protein
MVFSRQKSGLERKNLFCYSSLLRLVPFEIIFLPKDQVIGRKLATGRWGGVISVTIVLQKLIHCLQCLIVFIEDLQVLHSGRGLSRGATKAGEVCNGSAAGEKSQCQSPGKRGSKLSAGIEQQPALQPLEPARWRHGLLFAETDGQLLIKVGRRLRGLPRVEQRERRFKRLELPAALGARLDMAPRSRIQGRAGVDHEIKENGLAVFAVHREPFQFLYDRRVSYELARVF